MGYLDGIVGGVSSFGSAMSQILIIGLYMTPIFIVIMAVLIAKKYRNKICLRYKTKGDTDKVIVTGFAIIRRRGEAESIKTMKNRLQLPLPPDEAIDIQENGAWYCEGYVTETGQVTWIDVQAKRVDEQINVKETVKTKAGDVDVEHKETKESIQEIRITKLSTQDKAFYLTQAERSSKRWAVNDFWGFLNANAGAIVVVIVFFGLIIYWGDINKPILEAKEMDVQIATTQGKSLQMQKEINEQLERLINNRQVILASEVNVTTLEGPE